VKEDYKYENRIGLQDNTVWFRYSNSCDTVPQKWCYNILRQFTILLARHITLPRCLNVYMLSWHDFKASCCIVSIVALVGYVYPYIIL